MHSSWTLSEGDQWARKVYIASSDADGSHQPNVEVTIKAPKADPLAYIKETHLVTIHGADSELSLKGLQVLLYFLDHPDSTVATQARQYIQYYLDPQRSRRLLSALASSTEWRHHGALHHDYYKHITTRVRLWIPDQKITRSEWERYLEAYTDAGKQTAERQAEYVDDLICLDHLCRFEDHRSGIQGMYGYAVCSVCKSTINSVRASKVVAVIDPNMVDPINVSKDTLRINALKRELDYHFNEVEIHPCSPDDIKHFCIQVGNDTDPTRARCYKHATITIAPTTTLTPETKQNLTRFFPNGF